MGERVVVILLGPPGAGKGTQARRLAARSGYPHVSTGDILRQEVRDRSDMGMRVEAIMNAGELVPDELVARIIGQRLERDDSGGFLLDGFPRNMVQARYLESVCNGLDLLIINLTLEESEVIKRLTGRRQCSGCGKIYNLAYSAPQIEAICDVCNGALIVRPDDRADVILERLRVYREQTVPLVEHYRERGYYREVDGSQGAIEVSDSISEIMTRSGVQE